MNTDKEIDKSRNPTSKYYYDHFTILFDSVNRQYSDLFEPQIIQYNLAFSRLELAAGCLLVRLMLRTKTFFVVEKIQYSDIESIPDAVDQLVQAQFASLNPNSSIHEILPLLTKKEWLDLIKECANNDTKASVHAKASSRKEVEAVVVERLSVAQVYRRYSVIKLNTKLWLRTLQFLYFSNMHQSLSEFVLTDLNIRSFEDYSLAASDRLFDSKTSIHLTQMVSLVRSLLDQFLVNKGAVIQPLKLISVESIGSVAELAECVLNTMKNIKNTPIYFSDVDVFFIVDVLANRDRNVSSEDKAVELNFPLSGSGFITEDLILKSFFVIIVSLENLWEMSQDAKKNAIAYKNFVRRRKRLCYQIGYQLERSGHQVTALNVYDYGSDGSSMERRIRILAELGYHEKALSLCQTVFAQSQAYPLNADGTPDVQLWEFVESFGHRLSKKSKHQYWPKPTMYAPIVYDLTWDKPEHPMLNSGAEEAVICHLKRCGMRFLSGLKNDCSAGDCYFVENNLIMTVFSLCYWDVFYQDVKGAFTHPFQAAPHDLYDTDFLHFRKELKSALDKQWFSKNYLPLDLLLEKRKLKKAFQSPFVGVGFVDEEIFIRALTSIPSCDWKILFDRLWLDLKENRKGFPDLLFIPHGDSFFGSYCLIEVKAPNDKLQNHQRRWMKYFHSHNIQHCVVNVKWKE